MQTIACLLSELGTMPPLVRLALRMLGATLAALVLSIDDIDF